MRTQAIAADSTILSYPTKIDKKRIERKLIAIPPNKTKSHQPNDK